MVSHGSSTREVSCEWLHGGILSKDSKVGKRKKPLVFIVLAIAHVKRQIFLPKYSPCLFKNLTSPNLKFQKVSCQLDFQKSPSSDFIRRTSSSSSTSPYLSRLRRSRWAASRPKKARFARQEVDL